MALSRGNIASTPLPTNTRAFLVDWRWMIDSFTDENDGDNLTGTNRSREHGVVNPARMPPVEVDPWPCKLQANFRCPPPPTRLTSLKATFRQHVLHLRELHITHAVRNERQVYPSLQQGASSYRLLTASIFFDSAYPHITEPAVCVSLRYLVFHSLVHHHVLHDDERRLLLQVTAHVLQPQTIGAVGRKATTRYVWASTKRCPSPDMRCCCISAHLGDGPSSTTNERRWFPFVWTRKQADLRRRILVSEISYLYWLFVW